MRRCVRTFSMFSSSWANRIPRELIRLLGRITEIEADT